MPSELQVATGAGAGVGGIPPGMGSGNGASWAQPSDADGLSAAIEGSLNFNSRAITSSSVPGMLPPPPPPLHSAIATQQQQGQQQQQRQQYDQAAQQQGLFGVPFGSQSTPARGTTGSSSDSLLAAATGPLQTYDVSESEQFGTTLSLRCSPATMVADASIGAMSCKGSLIANTGANDVTVLAWRKHPSIAVDMAALRTEIKQLRVLAKRSSNVALVLHMGSMELASDLIGMVSEASELGALDNFVKAQVEASNGQPPGIPELQSYCVQLIDALMHCHESNVMHRAISPGHILVTPCADKFNPTQFPRGLLLKLSHFVPPALLSLSSSAMANVHNMNALPENGRWYAPELTVETIRSGKGYHSLSDVWSLGLIIYYIATSGLLPFESHQQACEAVSNPNYSKHCLEQHGLQNRCPMLYDLIERMLYPVQRRVELRIIRCHPFLWSMATRKHQLISFANTSAMLGSSATSESIHHFVTRLEKISPLYVFGEAGWIASMTPRLLELVPMEIRTGFWWSGSHLLQAVKEQLLNPEQLVQSVYTRMTSNQATHAYLRQITEVDFPRMLILLYELGGLHGKWMWDGDEVTHQWH